MRANFAIVLATLAGFGLGDLSSTLQSCTEETSTEAVAKCVLGKLPEEFYTESFEVFRERFNKTYTSDAEKTKRFGLFKNNFVKVLTHNNAGKSYTQKITNFSDLTEKEFNDKYLTNFSGP